MRRSMRILSPPKGLAAVWGMHPAHALAGRALARRRGGADFVFALVTVTHSVRWHKHYHSTGSGHVYQNRFKAFAVADDEDLLTVLRYIERNPVRAGLVEPAQEWPWSSVAAATAAAPTLDPRPIA